jgi:hypothetical protein
LGEEPAPDGDELRPDVLLAAADFLALAEGPRTLEVVAASDWTSGDPMAREC